MFYCSVNTTLEGNAYKISTSEANDVINKTPGMTPPQPIEPIGKTCLIPTIHIENK